MGDFKPSPKTPPPAYMVSFCDMMTLILTFFILLVSMSKEQKAGLAAAGVGSFIIAVQSHGMPGVLSGREEMEVFENQRRKFNVPQDVDEEDMSDVADGSRSVILSQVSNGIAIRMAVMSMAIGSHAAADREDG